MPKPFKYSAAVPTMNRPDELRQCVKRVLAQNPPPQRFIILDDGDLDAAELRALLKKSGCGLLYHKKDEPGLIASLNLAADLCESEWILLLDDDIYLQDGFMENMIAALENVEQPDLLAGIAGYSYQKQNENRSLRSRLRLFMERIFLLNGGLEGRFFPSSFCSDYDCGHHPEKPWPVEHVPGGLGLWRTEILRRYRFDEFYSGYAYGNDKELAYRVSRDMLLLCQPASRALHDKSPRSRMDPFELGGMKIRNQFYFYRNTFQKGFFSPHFFAWALLGLLFLDSLGALFSREPRRRFRGVWGMLAALSRQLPGEGGAE